MPRIKLDLSDARAILAEALAAIEEVDGYEGDVDYDRGRSRQAGPSNNRHRQAEIARDLMRASELAAAAAGELSLKYWSFKGFRDPRQRD